MPGKRAFPIASPCSILIPITMAVAVDQVPAAAAGPQALHGRQLLHRVKALGMPGHHQPLHGPQASRLARSLAGAAPAHGFGLQQAKQLRLLAFA